MRIAILDENRDDLHNLRNLLESACRNSVQAEIICFDDMVRFFEAYRLNFDVIFCEAEFSYAKGVNFVKRIRQMNGEQLIVFVTEKAQYAVEGYDLGIFGFLQKPLACSAVHRTAERVLAEIGKRETQSGLMIRTAGGIQRVNAKDITYVEVMKHRLTYHTVTGEIESWGALAVAAEQLPENFFRLNSSFLVNLRYVKSVENDRLYIGDDVLPLPKRRKKDFLLSYENVLGGRGIF